MKYIELFSGCGGLSLGLESLGLEGLSMEMVMANELSPMPANTFAFNLFNEDFESTTPSRVKWLSSKYDLNKFSERAKENPLNYPPLSNAFDKNCKEAHSDIESAQSLYKKPNCCKHNTA